MSKPTRYCIYGGPGSGKSTEAAKLFEKLKKEGNEVELVRERIKKFAYLERRPTSAERLQFFFKEFQEEAFYLENGINVVSDSPLMLALFYYKENNGPFFNSLLFMTKEMEEKYPSINIWMNRDEKIYNNSGRFHTLKESEELDKKMMDFVKQNGVLLSNK